MKNYIAILIVALCAVCLHSCDPENNFFFHPVEFKGEITEPKLVVTGMLHAGYTPMVFVNRSVFFTERKDETKDSVWRDEFGRYEYYADRHYLADATVEMRIDDGAWLPLHPEPYMSDGCYYTCDRILETGEKVTIRVQHKDFHDVATVSQRIPAFPHAIISLGQYTPDDTTIPFTIELPAYAGDSTDLLRITAITYVHEYLTRYDYYSQNTVTDTTETQYPYVYSQDFRFAPYDKMNKRLSSNYFGAGLFGLYTAVPMQPTQYAMRAVVNGKYYYSTSSTPTIDSIVVNVAAVSRDEYLNAASIRAARYYNYDERVPDYFSTQESTDMTDIIEIIQDIFDEMGNMEATQLYDNVDGGIGHVSSATTQHFRIIPN